MNAYVIYYIHMGDKDYVPKIYFNKERAKHVVCAFEFE